MNVRQHCKRLTRLLKGGATLEDRHYQALRDEIKIQPKVMCESWFGKFMHVHRDNLIRINKGNYEPYLGNAAWIEKHNALHELHKKLPSELDTYRDMNSALCNRVNYLTEQRDKWRRKYGELKAHADHFARRVG